MLRVCRGVGKVSGTEVGKWGRGAAFSTDRSSLERQSEIADCDILICDIVDLCI